MWSRGKALEAKPSYDIFFITKLLILQVDLALEARHLWQFNYNFRHSRNVRFPYPIYPLVAPEVLVETYEAGEGISSYVADPGRSTFKSRCRATLPFR